MKPELIANKLFVDGLELFSDAAAVRAAPTSFMLLPFGKIAFTKGTERGELEFGPEDADKILADFAARSKDGVIDYEHQTLSGEKAPAAGWIQRLEKTAAGLVAHVKYWTEQATNHLKAGEYRYSSPVLHTSRRRPFALHSVALTNHPAIHGLPALVASDDAADNYTTEEPTNTKELTDMNELLKLLGIAALADATATEKLIVETVSGLVSARNDRDAFLKLHDAKTLDEVTGKIKGMVPAGDKLALESRLAAIEGEKAVSQAFADGKLIEAQRDWALKFAAKDLASFNDFIAKQPKVAPGPAGKVNLADNTNAMPLTDDALGKQFDGDANLQAEFRGNKKAYVAYCRAEADGKVQRMEKK